jgi:NADP-dependent aldehyde dehydrogenase
MDCISYLQKNEFETTGRFHADNCVELEACGDELIQTAMRETNLPEARMRNERAEQFFN